MKIRLLQTIKGKGTLWLKDTVMDDAKEPFHTDIHGYLDNPYIVEILIPNSPPPVVVEEEKTEIQVKEVITDNGKEQEQSAKTDTTGGKEESKEIKKEEIKLKKRSKK